MSLFVRSKFASNLLTHNRRGDFSWERCRNIKIFQTFFSWKAPSIMCYRRVQYGLAAAKHSQITLVCIVSRSFASAQDDKYGCFSRIDLSTHYVWSRWQRKSALGRDDRGKVRLVEMTEERCVWSRWQRKGALGRDDRGKARLVGMTAMSVRFAKK